MTLELQAIKALTALAQSYLSQGRVSEARPLLYLAYSLSKPYDKTQSDRS
jgi:hypothetical protein